MTEFFQFDVDSGPIERLHDVIAGSGGKKSFETQLKISIGSILKRTRAAMKTAAWKEVGNEYTIKQSDFYKYTKVKNVKQGAGIFGFDGNDMIAEIEFSGQKIPLSKFDVKGIKNLNKNRITDTVKKRLRKNVSPTTYKDAFYALINSHLGVYERYDKSRLPIKEITALAGPQMVGNEEVLDNIADVGIKTFDERAAHEIDRILNGWNI